MAEYQPRWPSLVAMFAIAGLRFAMPSALTLGPDWVLVPLVVSLGTVSILSHRLERHGLNRRIGFVLSGIVTCDMIASLSLLIWRLPAHHETPKELLVAATGIWVSNILVFASWYWRLDAGGPHARDLRDQHEFGAFLFPQMTLDDPAQRAGWKPGFVDYLFLAFNTSTAFSPTDVPVLSRWAKMLMMVQSAISLGAVVVLGARAVNIL